MAVMVVKSVMNVQSCCFANQNIPYYRKLTLHEINANR